MMRFTTILKLGSVLALLALLSGCNALAQKQPLLTDKAIVEQAAGPEQGARLHSELVRGMIDRGQYYAALAHLEEQERKLGSTDEIRYLRADTLSRLGRHDEAQPIYQGMLKGAYAAEAHHGIGLYYQEKGAAQAMTHLRSAVNLKPTDPEMRNDLGYALMLKGDKKDSRLHLATAFELSPASTRYRNNYLLALIWMGEEETARKVATSAEVDGKTMAGLRVRAQQLRIEQAEDGTVPEKSGKNAQKTSGA